MAACPPAAVTAATMLSDSDRAPDSTATVPLGNVVGVRQAIRQRQQTFRLGKHVVRRHVAASTVTDLPGYRRHLAAQVFYLFSTVGLMPIQAYHRGHSSTFRLIRITACSKVCSIRRVNTRPPTPSSASSAVGSVTVRLRGIPEELFVNRIRFEMTNRIAAVHRQSGDR